MQQILKAQGVHLSLARVTGQTLDLLQRSSMLGEIKPPLVFSSVRSGVSAYRYWLRQQKDSPPRPRLQAEMPDHAL